MIILFNPVLNHQDFYEYCYCVELHSSSTPLPGKTMPIIPSLCSKGFFSLEL